MADFTTSPPAPITLSVSAFLRMFGAGGQDTASLFTGTEEAAHTFVAPFAGVLVSTQTPANILTKATVGAVVDIGVSDWKSIGVIPKGTSITIKTDPASIDQAIGTIADFVSTPEPIGITSASFTGDSPASVALLVSEFTSEAPQPISLTPAVGLVFFGAAPNETLTAEQAKSLLSSVQKNAATGTYLCPAGGFKYLIVPVGVTAPRSIKDPSTNFNVAMALNIAGFEAAINGFGFYSLTIDGVPCRVFRTLNALGSSITLQVS